MNQETVNKILELMRSGKTQREAQAELGINHTTIGRIAKAHGFVPNRTEQNRKGQLNRKKPVRVTTSHNYMSISTEPNTFILNAF